MPTSNLTKRAIYGGFLCGVLACSPGAIAQEQPFPLLGEGGQTQAHAPAQPARPVAWLGVALADRSVDAQPAVFITHVHPGGPADGAGLKVGDRILRIGDTDLASRQAVVGVLGAREPGAVVAVSVQRDGADQQFDVTLGNRSDYIRDRGVCTDDDELLDDDANTADAELSEQNRRLTQMIQQLQQELNSLRAEVEALRKQGAAAPEQNLPTPAEENPAP